MTERMVWTVEEMGEMYRHADLGWLRLPSTFHLPAEPGQVRACTGDCDVHAIRCESEVGVGMPGGYQKQPWSKVCPKCKEARRG